MSEVDFNPPLHELTITRIFNAPRALVYEAFADPAQARAWAGPRGFVAIHFEQDVRPGGRWRACLRQVGEWNGRVFPDLWQGGEFKEVVPPERLVYTFGWEGQGGQPTRETLVTISLAEVDAGRTRMAFHQAFFDSLEQRDGHGRGWNSAFDCLGEFVAAREPTPGPDR